MTPSQLEHYLDRIDYRGPRAPSLDVLHALTSAHAQHIPFENLDLALPDAKPIDISPAAVFDKLVERRRGGYCFEQNGLFARVLSTLGFDVTPLSARVRLDRPPDAIPARTHLFLRVQLDGASWLTDVGVGGLSLTAALRFEPNLEQTTPHDVRRIVQDGERFLHQIRFGSSWTDVYEFSGEPMPEIDREVANWYTSTHPKSHFKNHLLVARAAPSGIRYSLLDRELKTRAPDGTAQSQAITDDDHLLALLDQYFGLHFEPGTRFRVAGA